MSEELQREQSSTTPTDESSEDVRTEIEVSVTPTNPNELEIAKEEQSSTSSKPYQDPDQESSVGEEKFANVDEIIHREAQALLDRGESDDEDDDTLSSEAIVDDIELILMPEEAIDIRQAQSPKLVRVRELRMDESGNPLDDEEDEDDECNFKKMDISERGFSQSQFDEEGNSEDDACPDEFMEGDDDVLEGAVGYSNPILSSGAGADEEEEPSYASSTTSGREMINPRYSKKRQTSFQSSFVQTDITALENYDYPPPGHTKPLIYKYYCRNSLDQSNPSGRTTLTSSTGKKLNWKSELTLLPSKTKIRHGHGGEDISSGGLMDCSMTTSNRYMDIQNDTDDRTRYSSSQGVAKFTSQDNVQSSSSQFLKPSTLYRTRNLSRNLNQLGSSETTFVLPVTEYTMTPSTSYQSPRFKADWTSGPSVPGASSARVTLAPQPSYQKQHQQQLSSFSGAPLNKSYIRSSMPNLYEAPIDITLSLAGASGAVYDFSGQKYGSSNRRRQSHHHPKYSRQPEGPAFSSSGLGKKVPRKKSSSDEETSSLIDESERCLRSSIDLLLTDEFPVPGKDYPYQGSGSMGSIGYSRRYCSQPLLSEEGGFFGREREAGNSKTKVLGSPYLPRKLSDMRCSKWAKVILPNGQVSVVSIIEIDEIHDFLTINTDSGYVISIPFRKVVFAWKSPR